MSAWSVGDRSGAGRPLRLTTTEVCELARISRATLWRRIGAGALPAPIDRGRQALFDAVAVFERLNESRRRLDVDLVMRQRAAQLERRRRAKNSA